jgi:hypothetical protein
MGEDAMTEATVAAKDRAAALTATLDTIPGSYARIYLAPGPRVMFMSMNKNACTSLKWMMAGLAGEDLSTFKPGLMPFTAQEEAVHNRNLWKVSPQFRSLTPEEQGAIHPDNGWFIFAVVRDPRVRMFSAWQNKLVLENPATTQWRREDWFPRHPLTAQTVIEDFERFVDLFEREPTHKLRRDPHFRDQAEMLALDVVPYSKIYEIHEFRQLRADLQAHLDTVGWQRELLLPRFNDTPLRPNAAVFADGVRERVEKIYAADFEHFGDKWDYSVIESAPAWTDEALAEAELRASFGHRIGDLRNAALHQRARAEAETKRADAEAERAEAEARRAQAEAERAEQLQKRVQNLRRRLAEREAALAATPSAKLRRAVRGVRRRVTRPRGTTS